MVRVTDAGMPPHIVTCKVCELNNGLFWFMLEVCCVLETASNDDFTQALLWEFINYLSCKY